MTKYKWCLIIFLVLNAAPSTAQNNYEREHRIRKSQFPEKAHEYIAQKIQGAKRMRFYKEIDSTATSYRSKFKKDRLYYRIEFDEAGSMEAIGFRVREVDIPNEALAAIKTELESRFSRYHIRQIWQEYLKVPEEPESVTHKNAFQNLLVPSLQYEFFTSAKTEGSKADYELLFDAGGRLMRMRHALPSNYDRVLY